MTLVIPRGQAAQPGPRGGGKPGPRSGPAGTLRQPSRGPAATQYKRSPMATEGHRASE